MTEQPAAEWGELDACVFAAADAGLAEGLQVERSGVLGEGKDLAVQCETAQPVGAAVDVFAVAVFRDQQAGRARAGADVVATGPAIVGEACDIGVNARLRTSWRRAVWRRTCGCIVR